jgi:ppGpp synthetase/RelA/SpoT-type nucleotidyltranferase
VTAIEDARKRWIAERPKHEAFGTLLKGRLEACLKPLGLWFEVDSRAKTVDSLVKKLLLKRGHSFDSLPDKVGVRVVIRYRADVDEVIKCVRASFDSDEPENKEVILGTDRVGYLSVHLDHVRLRPGDADASSYAPESFWAELQVRTLAQHLWSEMSHDTVYKNAELMAKLPPDVQRRVALMAGQIEIADREFDRLNMELSAKGTVRLLQVLEKHYYSVASHQPNLELSVEVLDTLMPLVKGDVSAFAQQLNDFLSAKHTVIEQVYSRALEIGLENEKITAFLFQPEVLLVYKLLNSNPDETRQVWSESFPELELVRIANTFGLSLD